MSNHTATASSSPTACDARFAALLGPRVRWRGFLPRQRAPSRKDTPASSGRLLTEHHVRIGHALFPSGTAIVFQRPTTVFNAACVNKLSIVSTLVDAAMEFVRGRKESGVLLLGAAALSSRVPGLGTAVSLVMRLVRWLR